MISNYSILKCQLHCICAAIAAAYGHYAAAQTLTVDYFPSAAEEINFISDTTRSNNRLVINIGDDIANRVAPIGADINSQVVGQTLLTPWRDTTFRRTPNYTITPTNSFEIVSQVDQGWNFWFTPKFSYTIALDKLTIEGLNFKSDVVKFNFGAGTSTEMGLKLNNASLELLYSPTFTNVGTTSISVEPGTSNSLRVPLGMVVNGTPTLTVAGSPGMTADQTLLRINQTGDLNSSSVSEWLHLVGNGQGARINVDNGTLLVDNSRIHISQAREDATNKLGGLNVVNGGSIRLSGDRTILSVPSLYIKDTAFNSTSGSSLTVGTDSQLIVGNTLWLENSRLINYGSFVSQGITSFSGTSYITSPNKSIRGGYLRSDGAGAHLTLDSVGFFQANVLDLRQGAILDLQGSSNATTLLRVGPTSFEMIDATINIKNNATYTHDAGVIGLNSNNRGTINVENGGMLSLSQRGGLELSSVIHLSLQSGGVVEVIGGFHGNGAITGQGGELIFTTDGSGKYSGILSPGFNHRANRPLADKFGTVTTNASVQFFGSSNFWTDTTYSFANRKSIIESGLFNGGRYLADIGVVNGVAKNDKLLYGAGDVHLLQIQDVTVSVPDSTTRASDLNGKTFTLIAASAPGVTGRLIVPGVNFGSSNIAVTRPVNVVKDASVPALIDFTVTDLNTNGKPDFTLVADMHINNLSKNSGASRVNRTSAISMLSSAYVAGNTTVQSALNGLTTGNVASHLDSFHPEPYSSYITVGQQRTQNLLNTVSNAITPGWGTTSANRVEALTGSGKRFWFDANNVKGTVNGNQDVGSFGYSLGQFTLGQDLIDGGYTKLGVFASMASTKMTEHDAATQSFGDNTYAAGMYYDALFTENINLRGLVGLSHSNVTSQRNLRLGSVSGVAKAKYHQNNFFAQIKASQLVYSNDYFALEPTLGISLIHQSQSGISEQGSTGFELDVQTKRTTSLFGTAAVHAKLHGWTIAQTATPVVFVRYERGYQLNNDETAIIASMRSNSSVTQSFIGQSRGANNLSVGLGVTSQPNSKLQIIGGVVLALDSNGREAGWGLQMKYAF